jgi:hypothetical protein
MPGARGAPPPGAGGGLLVKPLAASVNVSFALPQSTTFISVLLTPRVKLVQLLANILGLSSVLGVFGILFGFTEDAGRWCGRNKGQLIAGVRKSVRDFGRRAPEKAPLSAAPKGGAGGGACSGAGSGGGSARLGEPPPPPLALDTPLGSFRVDNPMRRGAPFATGVGAGVGAPPGDRAGFAPIAPAAPTRGDAGGAAPKAVAIAVPAAAAAPAAAPAAPILAGALRDLAREAYARGALPPLWDFDVDDGGGAAGAGGGTFFIRPSGEATWDDPREEWDTFEKEVAAAAAGGADLNKWGLSFPEEG